MTKYEAYIKLENLGLPEELLDKCLVDLSLMNEGESIDNYVNKLSNEFSSKFVKTIESKPLYKSISSDLVDEQLKGMSSFLTHVVIQKLSNSNFSLPCVKEVWESLGEFLLNNDRSHVSESCKSILEDLKEVSENGSK